MQITPVLMKQHYRVTPPCLRRLGLAKASFSLRGRLYGSKHRDSNGPIRFVQIRAASQPNISLPGTALRSTGIQIMGSGIGSVALEIATDAAALAR
jgi:hypothetical protein